MTRFLLAATPFAGHMVPMRQAQAFDDADLEATFPSISEGGNLSSLLASAR